MCMEVDILFCCKTGCDITCYALLPSSTASAHEFRCHSRFAATAAAKRALGVQERLVATDQAYQLFLHIDHINSVTDLGFYVSRCFVNNTVKLLDTLNLTARSYAG